MNIREKTLVIIACGKRKIWDKYPKMGAVQAKDVYISSYFNLSKKYAEKFSDEWIILSAKYGFVKPNYIIPGNYNVSFNDSNKRYISKKRLLEQIRNLGFKRYTKIIVLGGSTYYKKVQEAFQNLRICIENPLEGLGIGSRQKKLKELLTKEGFSR